MSKKNVTIDDVRLQDDGTLDTVFVVNGQTMRYSQEFIDAYRNESGEITDEMFEELREQVLNDYLDDYGEELTS